MQKSKLLNITLLFFALILLLFASYRFWDWYQATHGEAPPPSPQEVLTSSPERPDERKVKSSDSINVPPDQPYKIHIDTIGVNSFIQRVGIDAQGAIVAPSNIHYAGWYVHSVKPGEDGLSIIDGHVSGRYSSSAVFHNLKLVNPGDLIIVQYGDRSERHFEVVEKQEIKATQASQVLLTKKDTIEKQLNLITCTGPFNGVMQQYENRLVVVTKQID